MQVDFDNKNWQDTIHILVYWNQNIDYMIGLLLDYNLGALHSLT